MTWDWFVIPLISGFIGWVTNAIAIKMLFRPLRPINIGPMVLWGIIPRRREALAEKISELVERELLDLPGIIEKLATENHRPLIEDLVEEFIEKKVRPYILSLHPILGGILPPKFFLELHQRGVETVEKALPGLLRRLEEPVVEKVHGLVRQKIFEFDAEKMEELILKISARELLAIELLGGILGWLIGFAQVFLMKFFG